MMDDDDNQPDCGDYFTQSICMSKHHVVHRQITYIIFICRSSLFEAGKKKTERKHSGCLGVGCVAVVGIAKVTTTYG